MTRITADEEAREIVENWEEERSIHLGVATQASLQSAISSTITRYAEALEVALSGISSSIVRNACETKIDSILSRSDIPEMEEVAATGYICPTCLSVWSGVPTCECTSEPVPFSHTIQRPKAKPVVKSVSISVQVDCDGEIQADDVWEFKGYPQCHSKHGTLTFTWTEPTK